MIPYISTKDMSREQWLEARRKGIGGSDAAAIMGASPWATPLTVYADKLGLLPEKEDSEAMRQGRDFEAYVASRFEEESGKKVRRCNKMFQHPEYPWMLANIDRDVVGESAGLECKTTSVYNPADFEGGNPPTYYLWQCMHYMAVTGAERWYLAVAVLSKAFYVFTIERDEALIQMLIEAEKNFWENHVQAHVPPIPRGMESEHAALAAMYPDSEPVEEDLTDVREQIETFYALKEGQKNIEQRAKELQQAIQIRMKNAERGKAGEFGVRWKSVTASRLDEKRLKAEAPEIYERYLKPSAYRRFEVRRERV